MKTVLMGYARLCKLLLRSGDWHWARCLRECSRPIQGRRFVRQGGCLEDSETGIRLRKHRDEFLLGQLSQVERLMALCSLRLSESPDGRRIAEFPEFRIYLRSAEEVYILAEILVEGVYNFMVPEPCAVLDIGMNVGIASLFFATRAGAAYVVGYEPFARTYACLQENLGLNPHLNGRIKAVQAGVAGANGSVEAEYSHDMQGSSGPVGFTKPFAPGAQVSRERLDVRGAREVADDFLREAAPKASVFALKIDCEGAEYEIVPALGSSGRLASFKAVMIEWHGRGPQPLVDVLRRASFSVFSFTSLGPRTGMIYAIR